jgi:hypothetical protein
MSCILTPTKKQMLVHDDIYEPKSETSTSCPSDDDHDDIVMSQAVDGYHYESAQVERARLPNHKLKN